MVDSTMNSFLNGLFCLILLLGLACAQTNDETDPISSALLSREFSKALELLTPALRESPNDARLWAMQGTAYEGTGRIKDAFASFQNALKIEPDYLPALQGAAHIEFESGSPAGIPLLRRLLRLRPADPIGHGMLAVLEYQQGNCVAAVPHFQRSGAVFDTKPDALHAYATCLVRLRETDKAVAVEQRALAVSPDDRKERRLLASLQLMAHQPEAALAVLQPALSPDPDAETLELSASAYESLHDTEKAVNALRQAILLQPDNTGLYLDFANMAADHQSFQLGIDVVGDGLALQPQSALLYFARGMLYAQLADYKQAETDFETAYRLDPGQSLTTAAQGMMAVQQNNLDDALKKVEKEIKARPNDPILLYLRADILTQQGVEPGAAQFLVAMRSAKESVSLRPSLAPTHAVLAKLYLQSGDYQRAIKETRRSLELNPKDQTSVYRLIQALRKAGNTTEIPDLLKRLAQLREQAMKEERERYRYKLVETESLNPPERSRVPASR